LKEKYKAVEVFGMEADDRLGIEQCKNLVLSNNGEDLDVIVYTKQSIICSLDKDLNMIPGWHYNWRNNEKYLQDELSALRCFYCQLLTGDPTDNILGLFGVGSKSSYVNSVNECTDEFDMYAVCRMAYEQRFGNHWWKFLIENAELLWILRSEDDDIVDYLYELGWRYDDRVRDTKEQGVQ
jgi:hypothetical protein